MLFTGAVAVLVSGVSLCMNVKIVLTQKRWFCLKSKGEKKQHKIQEENNPNTLGGLYNTTKIVCYTVQL